MMDPYSTVVATRRDISEMSPDGLFSKSSRSKTGLGRESVMFLARSMIVSVAAVEYRVGLVRAFISVAVYDWISFAITGRDSARCCATIPLPAKRSSAVLPGAATSAIASEIASRYLALEPRYWTGRKGRGWSLKFRVLLWPRPRAIHSCSRVAYILVRWGGARAATCDAGGLYDVVESIGDGFVCKPAQLRAVRVGYSQPLRSSGSLTHRAAQLDRPTSACRSLGRELGV